MEMRILRISSKNQLIIPLQSINLTIIFYSIMERFKYFWAVVLSYDGRNHFSKSLVENEKDR